MAAQRRKKLHSDPLGRYLRRFTLQNVRTFRSPVTLDFCHANGSVAQWTVILGENGTGKTTLLQYIAGMMQVQDRELPKTLIRRGKKSESFVFRPFFSGEEWLSWHIYNLPVPWSKPMKLTASLDVSCAASLLSDAKPSEFGRPIGIELTTDQGANGEGKVQVTFTGSVKLEFYEQFRLFAYGASRHVASSASPYLSSDSFQMGRSTPVSSLFHDDLPLISPEQWFLSLDHMQRTDLLEAKRAEGAFKSAVRCITSTLPDIKDAVIGPHGYRSGQTPLTLLFKTPFSNKGLPFSALSVGYRTMAAWLTDFIKRMHEAFPDMDEPDNGPAVVLIDEFDLHMHPKWQREAMAALSKEFPNTQFIVTAHSPLIVQATEGDAKIIVLRRKKCENGTEEVEVINDPHYAAGWRVDQILASDLYDLPPRSPKFDALMKERVELRQKDKRSAGEKKRLAEIEQKLDEEAPPESLPGADKLFAKLERALDRAEAQQKK